MATSLLRHPMNTAAEAAASGKVEEPRSLLGSPWLASRFPDFRGQKTAAEAALGMKKQLLFVDDDANCFEGIRRGLRGQRAEWDLIFAPSVNEALKVLRAFPVDIVIADVHMSGKDGFALLSAVRETPETCDVPVIMVTGDGEHSLKRRALDLGATDLLSKPLCVADLEARIRSGLREKSYQDQIKAQNRMLEETLAIRTRALEKSHLDVIWRLAKAGEYRDEDTGNHVLRVAHYSRLVAENLGLDPDVVQRIFLTSPLHDIGKIGISDTILLKQGGLTPEEREVMKQHCVIGAEILLQKHDVSKVANLLEDILGPPGVSAEDNPFLKMASTIALGHHERWDGHGYPNGLAGHEIPIESRIVALADVFDALCSKRPYKPAYSEDKALNILRSEVGRHFDPGVFQAFDGRIDDVRAIHAQFSSNDGDRAAGDVQ